MIIETEMQRMLGVRVLSRIRKIFLKVSEKLEREGDLLCKEKVLLGDTGQMLLVMMKVNPSLILVKMVCPAKKRNRVMGHL